MKLALNADFGPEAMAAELAKFSKQALAEYLTSEEEPPGYVRYVNGRKDAPEESVRVPGPIIYRFVWWPQILSFAMAFLRARSPTGGAGGHKGRPAYKDSFFVLAEGREKHPRQWSLIPPDSDEVIITNDAPYHRKVDVQLAGGKALRISVPPGIMEDGAAAINARFGGLVRAKRVYSTPHSGQWLYQRGRREGKPVDSPGIVITPRG
jgi:hypothetical protein